MPRSFSCEKGAQEHSTFGFSSSNSGATARSNCEQRVVQLPQPVVARV
jgi:hypothetical protein